MKKITEETMTIDKRNVIHIENAKILFKNFTGGMSKGGFEEGPNFTIFISDEDIAHCLMEDFNFKLKEYELRDNGEMYPGYLLNIKIKYDSERPPVIHVAENGIIQYTATEEMSKNLDYVTLLPSRVHINPYRYKSNANQTAYLRGMVANIEPDDLCEGYTWANSIDVGTEEYHREDEIVNDDDPF